MFQKPWKYEGILYEKYFWETAKTTKYYDFFKQTLAAYDDSKKLKDQEAGAKLLEYAKNIANDPTNFKNTLDRECKCLLLKRHQEVEENMDINILDDFLNLIFGEDAQEGSLQGA